MEKLRIEWNDRSKGSMELNVDKFFPCTADKATKVFKLVARWCSDETIAELKEYFYEQTKKIDGQIDEIKRVYPSTSVGSKEKKQCETDFKKLQTLLKKYNSNIKLLEKYTERK